MASVAILYPQDCLKQSFPIKGILKTPSKSANPSPVNINNNRRRKRTSPVKNRGRSPPPGAVLDKDGNSNKLVMGQVKILKRGEDVKLVVVEKKVETVAEKAAVEEKKAEPSKKVVVFNEDKVFGLGSVERFGPDPVTASKQIRFPVNGFYAGSAFVTSPPPSSLPMPGFCNKKVALVQNEVASSDLRRILGVAMA